MSATQQRPCLADHPDPHDFEDHCHVCRQFLHSPRYHALWGGPGLRAQKRQHLPCRHLGAPTGQMYPCGSCSVVREHPIRKCALHGECLEHTAGPGLRCCRVCADREENTYLYLAPGAMKHLPAGRELGRCEAKPWQYQVSVALPHLDTPEQLELCIDLLGAQTVAPYFLVIDTGSRPEVCTQLERLRAPDLEVHYLKGHAWMQSSAVVSVAQDVAMALCRSEYLFCTHTDVFAKRQDLLEWLLTLCSPQEPVVGYGMSERSWATERWQECVGHQCLMLHVPTLREAGVTWNMENGYRLAGWTGANARGWPDTETGFSLSCLEKGVPIKFLGREINTITYQDENLVHVRTWTGACTYLTPGEVAVRQVNMERAMTEGRERLASWRASGGGVSHAR